MYLTRGYLSCLKSGEQAGAGAGAGARTLQALEHQNRRGYSSLHQEGFLLFCWLLSISITVLCMDGWIGGCFDTLLEESVGLCCDHLYN